MPTGTGTSQNTDLHFSLQGNSEQGHFQDIGRTPWEVLGQPKAPGLIEQAPKGVPWL